MSKYIIDVGDAYARHALGRKLIIPVIINNDTEYWVNTNIQLTPYTEPDMEKIREEAYTEAKIDAGQEYENGYDAGHNVGYQQGLSDAWEAARKILQMHDLTVFGLEHDGVFESPLNEGQQMTPQEAIEKLKAYEQEAIQVGDEVLYGNAKGIVIRPEDSTRYASVFTAIGEHICAENKDLTKTGRHFPEIVEVLAKMKEEQS